VCALLRPGAISGASATFVEGAGGASGEEVESQREVGLYTILLLPVLYGV